MRVMAKIWLFVLLLTLVVGGCRRAPGEAERRLIAIDSLITAHPDSALALLAAVDTATLAEPDRAYHALLQTQAMYKAGVPVDDSTLICRAQRYYADHGPVDRQIRAMCYRASVAEDLGDPELAMRWYKRTELAARDHGDDYNTAYALMSMGVLYMLNMEDSLAVSKYKEAIMFMPRTESKLLMFIYQQLSQLYLQDDVANDSAMYYIDMTRRLAIKLNDTLSMSLAAVTLVEKYFYEEDFTTAIKEAVATIQKFGEHLPCECWHLASQSYAKLSLIDSAEYYFLHAPPPVDTNDSAFYFHSLALIEKSRGHWEDALHNETVSNKVAENEMFKHNGPSLIEVEKSVEQGLLEKHQLAAKKRLAIASAVAVILLVLFIVLIIKNKLSDKSLRKQVDGLRIELRKSEHTINLLSDQRAEACDKMKSSTEMIQSLNNEIAEINYALERERQQARFHISSHINKLRRVTRLSLSHEKKV